MSRIQDILSKAERDGTVRRTRALADDGPVLAPPREADTAASAPAFGVPRGRAVPPAGETPAAEPRPSAASSVAERGWTPTATASVLENEPQGAVSARLDPYLVAAIAPHSLAAEQYRSLRTRIKHSENGRALRTIVITSPAKGDGKSLTAANLALTMAQEFQQRVLLVDGDLRRPSVHALFGVPEGPGLSDVLMGAADLNQALVSIPDQHLTVLPAGAPPSHPAELLGSASMRRVMDTLRTQFDRILIDMPPVAPLADMHVVAPMADGILMIVRAGVTPKPAIQNALSGLDVSKVLGLVLNEAGETSEKYTYEGYGYIAG